MYFEKNFLWHRDIVLLCYLVLTDTDSSTVLCTVPQSVILSCVPLFCEHVIWPALNANHVGMLSSIRGPHEQS